MSASVFCKSTWHDALTLKHNNALFHWLAFTVATRNPNNNNRVLLMRCSLLCVQCLSGFVLYMLHQISPVFTALLLRDNTESFYRSSPGHTQTHTRPQSMCKKACYICILWRAEEPDNLVSRYCFNTSFIYLCSGGFSKRSTYAISRLWKQILVKVVPPLSNTEKILFFKLEKHNHLFRHRTCL